MKNIIKTTIVANYRQEPEVQDVLCIKGTYHRLGLGFVAEGDEGRKVTGGELIPGPWAYSFGLCTVVSNDGGTGAEREENLKKGLEHDVEEGDLIEINGDVYSIHIYRRQYIELKKA